MTDSQSVDSAAGRLLLWFLRCGVLALSAALAVGTAACTRAPPAPRVERLPANPIITPEMLPGRDGDNVNGPSVIRVPRWIEGRLGEYYLYFANHEGTYIRLAYSDSPAGPWTVYGPGTLYMDETVCNDAPPYYRHIASPDVHVDAKTRQIRMYFHCPVYRSGPRDSKASYPQVSLVATSADGLAFRARSEPLGNAYFRVFQWAGQYYALGRPGIFYRSVDGLSNFRKGPTLFTPEMRHAAVTVRNDTLWVVYTVVGDKPERLVVSTIDLHPDWMKWRATAPVTLLAPERDWEGGNLPLRPSGRGEVKGRVRQLRDPALFETNGRTYLVYSVAGESGLAIAEIFWK